MNIIALIGLKQMLMPVRVILIDYDGIYGHKVKLAIDVSVRKLWMW